MICDTMGLYQPTSTKPLKPYVCTESMVAGTGVIMEIDTGASVSLISEKEWTSIKGFAPQLTLNTSKAPLLHTYTGSTIQPLEHVRLGIDNNNQHHNFNAFVAL